MAKVGEGTRVSHFFTRNPNQNKKNWVERGGGLE